MALYFFDLCEGDHLMRDEHGTVCANDDDATRRARKTLAAIIAEVETMLAWDHTSINVRCEDGAHVARVGMTVEVETQNPVMRAVHRALDPRLDGG